MKHLSRVERMAAISERNKKAARSRAKMKAARKAARDRPVNGPLEEISVSAEMIAAGVSVFRELDQAGVGSACLVGEVYRAMRGKAF